MTNLPFIAPKGLTNPNLQTVLSSKGWHTFFLASQLSQQNIMIKPCKLTTDNKVVFLGKLYQRPKKSSTLIVLLHGWLGHADSVYMLTLTSTLLAAGYDVFCLNLQDHGLTENLNESMFNAAELEAIIQALKDLYQKYNYKNQGLGGFSLGGNIALRIAAKKHKDLALSVTFAICPVLNPTATNATLNESKNILYRYYFLKKWKKSIIRKQEKYALFEDFSGIRMSKTIDEINAFLIPKFTRFSSVEAYFSAYQITNTTMEDPSCVCYAHFAKDDMIIPVADAYEMRSHDKMCISVSSHGGHCAFLKNWRLQSWQNDWALSVIQNQIS